MKTTMYICTHCNTEFPFPVPVFDAGRCTEGCPKCGYDGYEEIARPKMTKAELKQYIMLKRETERCETKLGAIRERGCRGDELYELVSNNRLRCMALLLKLQTFIYSIDDSLTRQIFELRYVKGMRWQGVAQALGGYYTADCVRIIHDRYLKM